MRVFTYKWFSEKVKRSIKLAGARYTPEINVSLPVVKVFDALARNDNFVNDFTILQKDLNKAWKEFYLKKSYKAVNVSKKIMNKLSKVVSDIDNFLNQIPNATFDEIKFSHLIKIIKKSEEVLREIERILRNEEKNPIGKKSPMQHTKYDEAIRHYLYECRKLKDVIFDIRKKLKVRRL